MWRVVAEAFPQPRPIGGELGVAEPLEDLQHRRRMHRTTTRGEMQHTVELDHRRRSPLNSRLGVTMRTIDIGQQLPPPHTQPEILERHRSRA